MRTIRASLLTRVSSAAAVAVLATGGVMATAAAASAANGHPKPLDATMLSIKNKPIAHAKHHADALTGVLRDGRTGVAGATHTPPHPARQEARVDGVPTRPTRHDGSSNL